MRTEPLDDDYRLPWPIHYKDTLCPDCGAELESSRCIDCEVEEELRLDAEWEALTKAATPNSKPR